MLYNENEKQNSVIDIEKEDGSMLTEDMIIDLTHGLKNIFGNEIDQIILYGSAARNEATEGNVLPFYRNIRKEGIVLWAA